MSAKSLKGQKPKFLAVDFFCGAGGTTRGLIDAKGYVIAGIDNDPLFTTTYTQNNRNRFIDKGLPQFLNYDLFPRSREYPEGQQRALFNELDHLLNFYSSKVKGVPLLFAICAPCQPFTRLSHTKLTTDRKISRKRDSNLLLEAAKFVERFRPELVLSENVAGIKNLRYGGIWDRFQARLKRLGYCVGTKVVCASDFGVPQFRKRAVMIAVRKDKVRAESQQAFQESNLLVPEIDPDSNLISVKEAIGHLPPLRAGEKHPSIPNHLAGNLSELNLKRIAASKPGMSNRNMKKTRFGDLSLKCHRKMKKPGFSDVYTRMDPDRPSPTITTKCYSISNGRFGHFDTLQDRGISLREAALLQSFPENYVFSPTEQYQPAAKMIGNAVPPKLAAYFAGYLANSFCL